jgi:hypothetical protein
MRWYNPNLALALGGAPWTPASLGSALVGWYKADTGVYNDAGVTLATNGQTVQQWNDQSGNGNHITQTGAGTNKPTLNTTGFNGLSTIVFTGSNAQWLERTSFAIGNVSTSSGFIAGVVNSSAFFPANVMTYNALISWFRIGSSTTDMGARDDSTIISGTTITNGTNLRMGAIWDGVNFTGYLNNVAGTPVASTATFTTNQDFLLGAYSGGASPFDGKMSEVIITNTGLSGTDRTNLDNYLRAEWGI